jgi:hypothetical protein
MGMNKLLPLLCLAAVAASAQTVDSIRVAADRGFSETPVAALVAQARVRTWDLASNDSNAGEIFATLVSAGGKLVCADERILVNSEYVTKQRCSVEAPVARLTVKKNDILWGSTTEVAVQGDASCQSRWLAIASGRHQRAELWHFCRFRGVALNASR